RLGVPSTPQKFVDIELPQPPQFKFKPDESFLAGHESTNIEDRRGYVGSDEALKTAIAANTAQLQELKHQIDDWLRGGTGSTGSAPYRFTGGGAAAEPAGGGSGAGGTPRPGGSAPGMGRPPGMGGEGTSPLGRLREPMGVPPAPPPAERPNNQFTPGNA